MLFVIAVTFNPFIAMMSLKPTNKSAKFETLKPLSSFSHWHVKGPSSQCTALKVDVIGAKKILFCRRARARFSPKIVQAGAVKRLK